MLTLCHVPLTEFVCGWQPSCWQQVMQELLLEMHKKWRTMKYLPDAKSTNRHSVRMNSQAAAAHVLTGTAEGGAGRQSSHGFAPIANRSEHSVGHGSDSPAARRSTRHDGRVTTTQSRSAHKGSVPPSHRVGGCAASSAGGVRLNYSGRRRNVSAATVNRAADLIATKKVHRPAHYVLAALSTSAPAALGGPPRHHLGLGSDELAVL